MLELAVPTEINLDTGTLAKLQEHARSKDGELLSNVYAGMNERMEWKCHDTNHSSWWQTPAHVYTSGTWCPLCSHTRKRELLELQDHALSRGGQLISEIFLGMNNKHEWKCSVQEHPSWWQTPSAIMHGKCWCPRCASNFPKTVLCIETGEIFLSIGRAANAKNVNIGNLRSVCIGQRRTAGGYHWEYA